MTDLGQTVGPRSAEDYQLALLDCYPPGDAFPRDPDTVRGKLVGAMGDGLSRAEAKAFDLILNQLDPRLATTMFPDWVDLTAVTEQPLHAQTVALIMTRLNRLGSQAVGYYIAVSAALGFTISLVEHKPRRHGSARMGTPYGLSDWAFVSDIFAPLTNYQHRMSGAPMGEPYAAWGNGLLETMLRRIKPAHVLFRFFYQ